LKCLSMPLQTRLIMSQLLRGEFLIPYVRGAE
jgi:hypothetical protein